jgi:hypothetical protein
LKAVAAADRILSQRVFEEVPLLVDESSFIGGFELF